MTRIGRRLKRWRGLIIFSVILLIIVVIALQSNRSVPKPLSAQATTSVQKRTVTRSVSVEGQVIAQDKREVYFPAQSRVREINFGTGSAVNKDDVLAEISTTINLREVRTEIKSPITGLITATNYRVDDTVAGTQPAFVIQTVGQLFVEAAVNENDIVDLVAGQKVVITIPALGLDQTYPGTVVNVYPAPVDGSSGAVIYPIRVQPDSLPASLRVGMSADMEIVTAQVSNVLAVPDSYIIEKDGQYYVKTITWLNDERTDYSVEEKSVTLGLRTDEYSEIKSGLSEGQEIVQPNFVQERQFSFFGG